jgi:hypothetical protein
MEIAQVVRARFLGFMLVVPTVQAGGDWGSKDWHKLVDAAADGDLERVKRHVKEGTPINPEVTGRTLSPLGAAALEGQVDVVRYLVSHGADVTAATGDPAKTALGLAMYAEKGTSDIVVFLLDKGGRPIPGDLAAAIHKGGMRMVRTLVEHGADVNALYGLENPKTPLAIAVMQARDAPEIAWYLLDHGADPSIGGGCLTSPAWHAAVNGTPDLFIEIAENGGKWKDIRAVPKERPGEHARCAMSLTSTICYNYLRNVKRSIGVESETQSLRIQKYAERYMKILRYLVDHGGEYRGWLNRDAVPEVPYGHGFPQCPRGPS